MKKRILVLAIISLLALFAISCSDDTEDAGSVAVPTDEDACINYDEVCDGNSEAFNCLATVENLDDCHKKCMGYGDDCAQITECINNASGELYDTYCVVSDDDEGGDNGDKLPEDSCMTSNCSYEYDACNNNANCVDIFYCLEDCDSCTDCDYNACVDQCMSEYRTGTSIYGDLVVCAGESGCFQD